MLLSRIDRYIFREIAVPTLLSLGIFSFVLVAGRTLKLADLVISKGVPLKEVVGLLASLFPSFFSITIPLSVLLGTLLAFARLSSDAEIIALKAAGISLGRMLKPTLLIALLATAATAWCVLDLSPRANHDFRERLYRLASEQAHVALAPRVFYTDIPGLTIYANRMHERTGDMEGVLIADLRNPKHPATIFANRGRLISNDDDQAISLALSHGQIHARSDEKASYQVVGFANYRVNMQMDDGSPSGQRNLKMKEIPLNELFSRIPGDTDQARRALAEIHGRFSLIPTPLLLALLALPLGIQSNRSGRGGGFTACLVVFLGYYMLVSLAGTLVLDSGWPVAPTMWAPPATLLACGLVLFRRASREQELAVLVFLQRRLAGIWKPHQQDG
ncbi:MAG: LPS export ABC transporter permease LptF [Deltaproteobacteria bacterium]|nr:MAG: LPS export ABC transporter permease LptF [Deltaproteobacteria bacterium]